MIVHVCRIKCYFIAGELGKHTPLKHLQREVVDLTQCNSRFVCFINWLPAVREGDVTKASGVTNSNALTLLLCYRLVEQNLAIRDQWTWTRSLRLISFVCSCNQPINPKFDSVTHGSVWRKSPKRWKYFVFTNVANLRRQWYDNHHELSIVRRRYCHIPVISWLWSPTSWDIFKLLLPLLANHHWFKKGLI